MSKHRFAVVGVLVALLHPFAGAADAPVRGPDTLRVMTYNIHITRGMDDKFDPARIAEVIKKADVDVVALQEVDVNANRSGKVDQVAELVRLTGMHGVFGKARDFDGGDYGQAILSRQPIDHMDVHKLPGADAQEERIALFTTIKQKRPLPDLLFIGTHLHHKEETLRVPQAIEVNRLAEEPVTKGESAIILCGDFNALPDSKVMKLMREKWDDTCALDKLTFPANKPDRNIDYVLVPKGHHWEVVSTTVLEEPVASDHRPVVVELRWKGK